jgi:hypothetical protein
MLYTVLLHGGCRAYDVTGSAEFGWQHIAAGAALLAFVGYFLWKEVGR